MPRILIVEDNADLLRILRELLSVNYEVVGAQCGEDAIAQMEQFQPDAVIMDVQLPGMNGLECARWIKAHFAPRHIPVLVLTALASAADAEAALSSGTCDAYMAKPSFLSAIRRKVEELLAASGGLATAPPV